MISSMFLRFLPKQSNAPPNMTPAFGVERISISVLDWDNSLKNQIDVFAKGRQADSGAEVDLSENVVDEIQMKRVVLGQAPRRPDRRVENNIHRKIDLKRTCVVDETHFPPFCSCRRGAFRTRRFSFDERIFFTTASCGEKSSVLQREWRTREEDATNGRLPSGGGRFVPIITSAAAASCNPGLMPLPDCVNERSEARTYFRQVREGDFVIEASGAGMLPWHSDGALLLVPPYRPLRNGRSRDRRAWKWRGCIQSVCRKRR